MRLATFKSTGKLIILLLIAVFAACKDAPTVSLQTGQKQPFEITFDKYSPEEKKVITTHVDKALSLIPPRSGELETAAAINDYVFQYFVNKDNLGNAVKLLNEGHAICGGAAVTMAEMLYSVDIKSRLAFLIGIPTQGAHSLVEVYFRDGTRGLFDPSFGIFWYDYENKKPVSIVDLLAEPELSDIFLYKTINAKRKKTDEAVKPYIGLSQTYQNRKKYKEEYYDPYQCFSKRSGGGVSGEEYTTYVKIPLGPGSSYGDKKGSSETTPWNKLAVLQNKEGEYISWAYMLGKTGDYNITHVYRFAGLQPGDSYNLSLYYAKAYNAVLSVQILNGHRPNQGNSSTFYYEVENLTYKKSGSAIEKVHIPFTADSPNVEIITSTEGYLILTAIESAPMKTYKN
ncbi:MAG: transglutaminase domain-containing protein [Nitrospirae bacterium]|nr:transglutaminase domain-containing protein [Nitrospirota bacterium]